MKKLLRSERTFYLIQLSLLGKSLFSLRQDTSLRGIYQGSFLKNVKVGKKGENTFQQHVPSNKKKV